jgi:hypothetical protein
VSVNNIRSAQKYEEAHAHFWECFSSQTSITCKLASSIIQQSHSCIAQEFGVKSTIIERGGGQQTQYCSLDANLRHWLAEMLGTACIASWDQRRVQPMRSPNQTTRKFSTVQIYFCFPKFIEFHWTSTDLNYIEFDIQKGARFVPAWHPREIPRILTLTPQITSTRG